MFALVVAELRWFADIGEKGSAMSARSNRLSGNDRGPHTAHQQPREALVRGLLGILLVGIAAGCGEVGGSAGGNGPVAAVDDEGEFDEMDGDEENGVDAEEPPPGSGGPIDVLHSLLEDGQCATAADEAARLLTETDDDEAAEAYLFRALARACLGQIELAQEDLAVAEERRAELPAESRRILDGIDRSDMPDGPDEVADVIADEP